MQRMSHREYKIWCAYLDEEWNTPSRTDHYLMQVSAELEALRLRLQKPRGLDSQRISFERRKIAKQVKQDTTHSRWNAVMRRNKRGRRS